MQERVLTKPAGRRLILYSAVVTADTDTRPGEKAGELQAIEVDID